METATDNTRAVVGNNQAPDYAQRVAADMARDYAEISKTVADLLDEARAAPTTVNSDEESGGLSRIVKRLRDTAGRLEAFRTKEKEPYLRGGNAVDQFFGALMAKCERQKKTDKGGAADILHDRVHNWNERKLAAEKKKREDDAREAQRIADEAAAITLAEENRLRDEEAARVQAQADADAAKRPATVAKLEQKAEQHAVAASAQVGKVAAAQSMENAARADLSDAKLAAAAKPSDMVRTRHDDGVLNTMRQVPYVELVDASLLNKDLLWPLLKEDHILMALKAYGKITSHKKPMAGAIIEMRNDTVIR